jgi:hypothetical protein
LILNQNAAAERGHISGYMSAHPDAAAKTSRFADFFIGANADVVSNLGAIANAVGERARRKGLEE